MFTKHENSAPLPRLNHHLSDLLYNEKFETWLNLQPIADIVTTAGKCQTWTELWTSPVGETVSVATRRTLEDAIVEIRHLGEYRVSPLLPGLMVNDIVVNSYRFTPNLKCESQFIDSLEVTSRVLRLQLGHLVSKISGSFYEEVLGHFEIWNKKSRKIPDVIWASYTWYTTLNNLIMRHKQFISSKRYDSRGKKYINFFTHNCKKTGLFFRCGFDCSMLRYQGKSWLLSMDYVKMIHNKLSELFNTLLYCHWQSGSSMPGNHFDMAVAFLEHISDYLISHRSHNKIDLPSENKGFIYLKTIEGLAVSYIIQKTDTNWEAENKILGEALWKSLLEQELVETSTYQSSPLYKLFKRMKLVSITELIGSVKICGHPSIEVLAGLMSLKEKTTKNITIDPLIRSQCTGMMIRDITKTYFFKHKHYPKFKSLDSLTSELQNAIRTNMSLATPHVREQFRTNSLEAWSLVVFDKNAEFEEVDQLLLLKDKAIGIDRERVLASFEYARSPNSRKFVKRTPEDRRAILNYLLLPEQGRTLERYLYRYENDEKWSDSVLKYLVIKLTPKELEQKPAGRMFGASPPEERARRIIQEYNTMEFMDKYEPSQLLTPGELQILQKLVAFREMRSLYPNHQIINISFDFSSWNNSMRSASVDKPAGDILDNWFGRNLYKKTMLAFKNSIIYYYDKNYQVMWEGQEGGIEGLNQATWSIVFVGGMKLALERLGYQYQVTVKGDDVRSAIVVPNAVINKSGYISVRDSILRSIDEVCRGMGWQLNPSESFVSSSLIATSKQYLVNRTWCPSSIKKIKKIESHSNIIFLTMEDLISSMYSVAHSACGSTTSVLPAFALATFAAARLITGMWTHHPRTFAQEIRKSVDRSHREVDYDAQVVLLCWPQVLGGPGALPLQTFFVRGENDMLSVGISLWRYLLTSSQSTQRLRRMVSRLCSQRIRPIRDIVILLGDPYSIDIDCPERPGHLLKKFMREVLTKIVVNKNVKSLLDARTEKDRQACEKFLSTMNPFIPKLCSAIWECTPFALVDEMLAKFTESGSIIGLLEAESGKRWLRRSYYTMLRKLVSSAKKRWNYWMTTLESNPMDLVELREDEINRIVVPTNYYFGVPIDTWLDQAECSTKIVHLVRQACWNRQLLGITYPSLVDQNEFFVYNCDSDIASADWNDAGNLIATVHRSYNDLDYQTDWLESDHYSHTTGVLKPWLGHKTSTRAYLPDRGDTIRSPTMIKIDKLICIRTACGNISETLQGFIDKLLQCYTEIDPEVLKLLAPSNMANHLAHRVQTNAYSLATMPNCRPNIAQTIRIDKNIGPYSHTDKTNRTINYAARHFYFLAICSLDLQFRPSYSIHTMTSIRTVISRFCTKNKEAGEEWCEYCCNLVDDVPVEMGELPDLRSHTYANLSLVHSTPGEEHSLQLGIASMLKRKQEKISTRLLHAVTDDDVMRAVVNVLQGQYNISKRAVHQLNQIVNRNDPINDDVLDLNQKLYGKVIHGDLEVPKTWAKCRSVDLYHAILLILWNEFSRVATLRNLEAATSVDFLPKYMVDGLIIMLDQIVKGGGIHKIKEGALQSDVARRHIVFPYMSEVDMTKVSTALWRQLIPIYLSWIRDPEQVPRWGSSIYGTNKEELTANAITKVQTALLALLRGFMSRCGIRMYHQKRHLLQQYFVDLYNRWSHNILILTVHDKAPVLSLVTMLWALQRIELIQIHELMDQVSEASPDVDLIVNELVYLNDKELTYEEAMAEDDNDATSSIFCDMLDIEFKKWLFSCVQSIIIADYNDKILMLRESLAQLTTLNTLVITFSTYDVLKAVMHSQGDPTVNKLEQMVQKDREVLKAQTPAYPDIPVSRTRYINNIFATSLLPEQYLMSRSADIQQLKLSLSNFRDRHQSRDELVSQSRVLGSSNRAIIRYIELMEENNWFLIERLADFTIIVIGDGGGSVSRLLLSYWKNAHVISTTMHLDPASAKQSSDHSIYSLPINFDPIDDLTDIEKRYHIVPIPIGDITNEACLAAINSLVYKLQLPVYMIISDADWFLISDEKEVENKGRRFIATYLNMLTSYSNATKLVGVLRWSNQNLRVLVPMFYDTIASLTSFSISLPYLSRAYLLESFIVTKLEPHAAPIRLNPDQIKNPAIVNETNVVCQMIDSRSNKSVPLICDEFSNRWSDFYITQIAKFSYIITDGLIPLFPPFRTECPHLYFERLSKAFIDEENRNRPRLVAQWGSSPLIHLDTLDKQISRFIAARCLIIGLRALSRKTPIVKPNLIQFVLDDVADYLRQDVRGWFTHRNTRYPIMSEVRQILNKQFDFLFRIASWIRLKSLALTRGWGVDDPDEIPLCDICIDWSNHQRTFIDIRHVNNEVDWNHPIMG